MTEQEFREKLKQSVGSIGLSSDRQRQVMAGMKEERSRRSAWGKLKIVLVVGIIVLLMTGGAVAGGRYLVDWHGKPMPTANVQTDQRMLQLMEWRTKGKWASIRKWDEARGRYTGILASGLEVVAPTLDKLQAWVTADGTLPWPAHVPAVYQMTGGSVRYACEPAGEIRMSSQEITEDGYIISYFVMPGEHRFVESYSVYLTADESQGLQIQVMLVDADGMFGLPMEDGSTFTRLTVDGMQQAIAVETGRETRVALRRAVQPALHYKIAGGGPDGVIDESIMEYDGMDIIIIGNGTPAELLAIFGLGAQ